MEDFTSAAAWLRSIIATTDNPTTFLWLLFVIQSTAWTKLAHFKPLVLLIRDIGPNLMRQKFWDVEASNLPADPQPPAFELCHNTGQYIRAALTEMVDLGTKAHEEEWNDAYLDWEFMVLTEKHLATKGGQAAMCNERGKARMKRAHRRQAAAAAAVAIQE